MTISWELRTQTLAKGGGQSHAQKTAFMQLTNSMELWQHPPTILLWITAGSTPCLSPRTASRGTAKFSSTPLSLSRPRGQAHQYARGSCIQTWLQQQALALRTLSPLPTTTSAW